MSIVVVNIRQESEATLRNMQAGDHGRGLTAGEELGGLDDGDEEDEIVLDASNTRQSNRPQGMQA